jgi:hypothetical protein
MLESESGTAFEKISTLSNKRYHSRRYQGFARVYPCVLAKVGGGPTHIPDLELMTPVEFYLLKGLHG